MYQTWKMLSKLYKIALFFAAVLTISLVLAISESVELNESGSSVESPETYMTEFGCICLRIYAPVCVSDGKTYANSCELNCVRKRNPYLVGVCHGECPCCKEYYHNEPFQFPVPIKGPDWGPGFLANDNSMKEVSDVNTQEQEITSQSAKEIN